MHVWPVQHDSWKFHLLSTVPHTQHHAMRSNESPLYLIWEETTPITLPANYPSCSMSTFLCVIFVCGEISLAAKTHRLTTIDHINMSTGGLSNSCTKTLPLAVSLVHNTSTGWHFFSFVYHGLGGFMSLYFSLFFFRFPVYPFLTSHLLRARVCI